MGFVNTNGYDMIMESARETQRLIEIGKFKEATSQWGKTEIVIIEVTGSIDFYNVLKPMPTGQLKYSEMFIDCMYSYYMDEIRLYCKELTMSCFIKQIIKFRDQEHTMIPIEN